MSAAAPTADAVADVAPKKGKKKLIVIVLAVVLLLAVAGGAALFLLKKKAPVEGDEEAEGPAAHAPAAHAAVDLKHPPTFLPLDPFVVNLADKDADRYAQIGITLELQDAKFGDELKLYMPAIRNGILMILAHKTSAELLERSGKEMLALQVQREAARTMGIEVAEPEAVSKAKPADSPAATQEGDDEAEKKPKKKAKRAAVEPNPILNVHFSNFIIQ